MNLPGRNYAYRYVLNDPVVRAKLIHGSDWPLPPIPPVLRVGLARAWALSRDTNWLRRDMEIKRAIGLDDAYFRRASTLLRLPQRAPAAAAPVAPAAV